MISSIVTKFENYLNHYALVKTRQLLLTLDDQLLERAGISRDLLRQGVAQWPWQSDEIRNSQIIATAKHNGHAGSALLVATAATETNRVASVPAESNNSYPAGEYVVEEEAHKAA